MAGAAQTSPQDFWRPPTAVTVPEIIRPDLETCERCGTEFIVGARFCHTCGASRMQDDRFPMSGVGVALGLSTGSLVSLLVGIFCVIAAISVGFLYNTSSVVEWQAVHLWRIEWLLGAVAAFVAGCLLKAANDRTS